jgi:hypothetical protein
MFELWAYGLNIPSEAFELRSSYGESTRGTRRSFQFYFTACVPDVFRHNKYLASYDREAPKI